MHAILAAACRHAVSLAAAIFAHARDSACAGQCKWAKRLAVVFGPGHVDNMCCFIRPGVVALAWSDNPDDPQAR